VRNHNDGCAIDVTDEFVSRGIKYHKKPSHLLVFVKREKMKGVFQKDIQQALPTKNDMIK